MTRRTRPSSSEWRQVSYTHSPPYATPHSPRYPSPGSFPLSISQLGAPAAPPMRAARALPQGARRPRRAAPLEPDDLPRRMGRHRSRQSCRACRHRSPLDARATRVAQARRRPRRRLRMGGGDHLSAALPPGGLTTRGAQACGSSLGALHEHARRLFCGHAARARRGGGSVRG